MKRFPTNSLEQPSDCLQKIKSCNAFFELETKLKKSLSEAMPQGD